VNIFGESLREPRNEGARGSRDPPQTATPPRSHFFRANFNDLFDAVYVDICKLQPIGATMTNSPKDFPTDPPSQPQPSEDPPNVGYKKPPKHSRFPKGKSGNLNGRPKAPIGISIKGILDGDQRGKNGEVISRREAYVIALVNDALRGNQKAFSKFMKLMDRSGLIRREQTRTPSVIQVPSVEMAREEFERNFGRPLGEPRR